MRIENDSPSNGATGISLDVQIPAGIIWEGVDGAGVSCTGLAEGEPGPATLTCTVPDLPAGELIEFDLLARTTAGGLETVVFEVQGDQPDPDLANNSVTRNTTVTAGADLRLDIDGPSTAAAGSQVDYTLTVVNEGPDPASGVQVQIPTTSGFSLTSSLPAGCSAGGSGIVCSIPGSIPSGSSIELGPFSGQIQVASGSDLEILASTQITASPPAAQDPDTDNNTDLLSIEVTAGSDVALEKTRSQPLPLFVGDSFDFVLSASFSGDTPFNLEIEDIVPSNYTIDEGAFQASQGPWDCLVDGQTVTCTRASGGASGANQSLGSVVIPVIVSQAGSGVVNSAIISAVGPDDPNPGNNTATDGGANLQLPEADLAISKTGPSPALVVEGQTFNYVLSARNNGPSPFSGTLVITDSLPAGLELVGITLNGWSCTPSTVPITAPEDIVCERDVPEGSPLAPGASVPSVVLQVEATTEGSITNVAELTTENPSVPDPNLGNNVVSYGVTSSTGPDAADLRVLKAVAGPDPVPAGDVLTYEIELVNDGPVTAEQVVVTDTLSSLLNNSVGPNGGFVEVRTADGLLAPGELTCSTGVFGSAGRILTCTVPSLPVCTEGGDCPVVEVDIRPNRATTGPRSNTAHIISNATADPDLSNNSQTVSSQVEARADVTIDKVGTPEPAQAGQDLVYVVSAINNGPSRADAVTIEDLLPPGVTFISAVTGPGGSGCSSTLVEGSVTTPGDRTVECALGNIPRGAQRTATITVRPTTGTRDTNLTNTATVATATVEPAPGAANNTAQFDVGVEPPSLDVLVQKVDTVDPVTVGDQTQYVVTVRNLGPSDAENVVIEDNLPSGGLSYQSHSFPAGSCSTVPAVGQIGGQLVCDISRLPSGEEAVLTLTMQGEAKGAFINQVLVQSDETVLGFDAVPGNNQSSENTTVRTRVDLELVEKTPSEASVPVREGFSWDILLRNNTGTGLAEADSVVLSDNLPSGMELTGTPVVTVLTGSTTESLCTGTSGDNAFSCDLGTVSNGAEVRVTVPVRALVAEPGSGVVTNTASVTTSSEDVVPGNNTVSGDVTIFGSSVSGEVFRDFNDNGIRDPEDTGIGSTTMTLEGTAFDGTPISATTTTEANGSFIFEGLPEGTYTIDRGTPAEPFLLPGSQSTGDRGGDDSVPGTISGISLDAVDEGTGYVFAFVPQARVGLAKAVEGAPVVNPDRSFTTTFRLRVQNYSLEPLVSVTLTDPLVGALPGFGTLVPGGAAAALDAGEYTIQAPPTFVGTCTGSTPNPGFDGDTDSLLGTIASLDAGEACIVEAVIRFEPVEPIVAPGYENQASVTATGDFSGQPVSDLSQAGTDPDPDGNGDPTDNDDPTPVDPALVADVGTITAFPAEVDAGEPVSGTVLFRNDGPYEAQATAFSIELTPGLEDVSLGNLPTGASATYDPVSGIVTLSDMPSSLAPGEIASGDGTTGIVVDYTQNGAAQSSVTGTISTSSPQGADAFADSQTSPVGGGLIVDVTTSVDFPAEVDAGELVVGSVLFQNLGPSTASDVGYEIVLTPDLEDVSFGNLPAGAGASYDPATGIVTFTGMPTEVLAGETVSGNGTAGIEVTYRQNGTATTAVVVEITTSTSQGLNVAPDQANAEIGGELIADVTTALDFPPEVDAGELVEGTVVFRNAGPSVASGVTYELQLDEDLADVEFDNLPTGATADYDPDTGIVTFSGMPTELAPGELASDDGTTGIGVRYTQPGTAISSVESRIGTTTNQGANIEPDVAMFDPGGGLVADVATTVSVPASVNAGDPVSAEVRFRNFGPSIASDVSYEATLTPGLEGVTFGNLPDGASASYDETTGVVTFTGMPEELLSGQTASGDGSTGITLSWIQPADATSTLSGEIATSTNQGADLAADTDSGTVTGDLIADVTTELSFPALVIPGEIASGTVVFRNLGPSEASGVTYGLQLPTGLSGVTLSNLPAGASFTYDAATGVVTLSDMPTELAADEVASGDGATGIEVEYEQPVRDISTIQSSIGTTTNQGANQAPDTAETPIQGGLADVTTSLEFPASVDAGSPVVGLVTFQNLGPTAAEGMTYSLLLEPGLEEVSFGNLPTGATASYDAATGVVSLAGMPPTLAPDDIASGDGATGIQVEYRQPDSGTSTVTSQVGTTTNQGANIGPDQATTQISGLPAVDLAVTKVADRSEAEMGDTVQYTIRVSNLGPGNAPAGATVTDTPAGLDIRQVTCSDVAENNCLTAPSIGDLLTGATLPALEVGRFFELTVLALVTASRGEVQNRATVAPAPGTVDLDPTNNTAIISVSLLDRPRLGLAKAVSPVVPTPDGAFRTTITLNLRNLGMEPLEDLQVRDALTVEAGGDFGSLQPQGTLTPGSYRVSSVDADGLEANSGFDGNTDLVTASGSLSESGEATVRIDVEFVPLAGATVLFNQAEAEGTGTQSGEPATTSSSAGTDPGSGDQPSEPGPTPLPLPAVGVAKSAGELINLGGGAYEVSYTIVVANLGGTPLSEVQVQDDLSAFGTHTAASTPEPGQYTVVTGPQILSSANGGALVPVEAGQFTGSGDGMDLLVEGSSALPNEGANRSEATIGFTLRFTPSAPGIFLNTAEASGRSPEGAGSTDRSVDGSEPDPNQDTPTSVSIGAPVVGAAKSAEEPTQTGVRRFAVPFRITILNMSDAVTATNVQVTDDLSAAFPTAESIVVVADVEVISCTDTSLELADPVFDGVGQTRLLRGDQSLEPGESCVLGFVVEVDYGANPVPSDVKLNQAEVTTAGEPGGEPSSSDLSQDGDDPDPDGDGDPTNNDDETPVPFVSETDEEDGLLALVKTTPLQNVSVGQLVPYTIEITNPNTFPVQGIELVDVIPAGFRYREGTASVDGAALPPGVAGRALSWGELTVAPGATVTVRLMLVVGAGVRPGEYINIARVGREGAEDLLAPEASAAVRVVPDPVFECSDIVGRVFEDRNGNGVQDGNERGIPGVRLATARGWIVTTGSEGRFHIACAVIPDEERGSNFVVKLDDASLPTGYSVLTENPKAIRVSAGRMTELNFAVGQPRAVTVEMRSEAFVPDGTDLLPEWREGLVRLEQELGDGLFQLELVYVSDPGGANRGSERLAEVLRVIRSEWDPGSLDRVVRIEQRIEFAGSGDDR